MKKNITRILVFIILFALLPLHPVSAADYSSYSNSSKSWGLYSKSDHSTPGGSTSSSTLKNYGAYYLGDTSKKTCYLTFDCGYEYGNTPTILDTLKKYDVKAVFFVTEHFVRTNPDLVKRMKEEGHLVGNHTSKHKRLPTLSDDSIKKEMQAVETAVKECTGYTIDKIMRPPEGAYSERVLKILQDMGYTTLFWSMAWKDWDVNNQPSDSYVIGQFKSHYHNGMVPLMHVVSTADTKALPAVIKYLRDTGFELDRFDNVYKADPKLKIKLKDFEYNGKGAKRNLIIKTLSKGKKTVVFYKKGKKKPMKNVPVSTGTYFVTVSQPTTANYRSATATLKFKIKRAVPEVELIVKGADPVSGNTVSGNTGWENDQDSDDNTLKSDPGSDDIVSESDSNPDHETSDSDSGSDSNISATDPVSGRSDTIYITCGANYSFKVKCKNKKGIVFLKYYDKNGELPGKPEAPGKYRVKAVVSGTKNYKKAVSKTCHFVIHE